MFAHGVASVSLDSTAKVSHRHGASIFYHLPEVDYSWYRLGSAFEEDLVALFDALLIWPAAPKQIWNRFSNCRTLARYGMTAAESPGARMKLDRAGFKHSWSQHGAYQTVLTQRKSWFLLDLVTLIPFDLFTLSVKSDQLDELQSLKVFLGHDSKGLLTGPFERVRTQERERQSRRTPTDIPFSAGEHD